MDRIEDIVSQTQRRVKGMSDTDNLEFSNHLKNTDDNWIDSWLDNPPELIQSATQAPPLELAKRGIIRRIVHEDFRDRFSDKQVEEAGQERPDWFEEILSSTLETYSRCLDLVK